MPPQPLLQAIGGAQPVAAALFGQIHGFVGKPHEIAAEDGVFGIGGYAQAYAVSKSVALEDQRLFLDGFEHPLSDTDRFVEPGLLTYNYELVAAVSYDPVVGTDYGAQKCAEVHEDGVSRTVTVCFVDLLEPSTSQTRRSRSVLS